MKSSSAEKSISESEPQRTELPAHHSHFLIEGNLVLLEAQEARWLTQEQLDSVKWLPADLGLIDRIREQMH